MTTGTYARPDTVVSTAWVADHLNDPKVRIVEVDVDTSAYEQGHVCCALGWNWTTQLCDTQVGERSSHTWFVLKYLLGYATVQNYDGSWTEWGNLVGAPVEKAVSELR